MKKCNHCKKPGHDEERWWIKNPNLKPKKMNAVEILAVEKISNVNVVEQETFLLDSGSEVHM